MGEERNQNKQSMLKLNVILKDEEDRIKKKQTEMNELEAQLQQLKML